MSKITIDRAVVEQVLEAWDGDEIEWFKRSYTVMENLRAALAEPVQEPAFHGFMSDDGTQVDVCFSPSAPRRDGTYATAYYTAPPHRVAQQAEPAQEPVAWMFELARNFNLEGYGGWEKRITERRPNALQSSVRNVTALYTAPPQQVAQQVEPLNLSDPAVQKRLATQWGYVPAAQAEPVEPVAWNWMLDGLPYGRACYGDPPDADIAERAATAGRTVRLLYTAPPQRKPLPKHDQHCVDVPGYGLTAVRLVRAIERAHGIT